MKNKIIISTFIFGITLSLLFVNISYSGPPQFSNWFYTHIETDNSQSITDVRIFFFDLRDRESYIQITNLDSVERSLHVQIFDVSNNCNENNFFDLYTPNDTHVYNMRNILTNDGNPSGVNLPNDAYGIVTVLGIDNNPEGRVPLIGNMRILDENGYEYRTNALSAGNTRSGSIVPGFNYTFNFNIEGGVILSDIIGINVSDIFDDEEIQASNFEENFRLFDVDIYNNNEVPFSCRDVVFACVDEDNPLLESLLERSGASVASFEYGINNAIPHSKDGELLCPGNVIDEGIVVLNIPDQNITNNSDNNFFLLVGLNNGNGRGSFDSDWQTNYCDLEFSTFLCSGLQP